MTVLTILRGLPASGKTTCARRLLVSQPGTVRLSRDDLRRMALPEGYGQPEPDAERLVTIAQHAALGALLTAGHDVVVDDTNLNNEHVQALTEIGAQAGAVVAIVEFFDLPLEECIRRDAARPESDRVGEAVIRGMHARHLTRALL